MMMDRVSEADVWNPVMIITIHRLPMMMEVVLGKALGRRDLFHVVHMVRIEKKFIVKKMELKYQTQNVAERSLLQQPVNVVMHQMILAVKRSVVRLDQVVILVIQVKKITKMPVLLGMIVLSMIHVQVDDHGNHDLFVV